jgi:hypothetical protein
MRTRAPWWRRPLAPFDPRSFLPDRLIHRARMRLSAAFARG